MANMKLLSIEPGNNMPVHDDAKMKIENTVGMPPDCPGPEGGPPCGAQHYMHERPDEDTMQLRCMDCGTVHTITGVEGS